MRARCLDSRWLSEGKRYLLRAEKAYLQKRLLTSRARSCFPYRWTPMNDREAEISDAPALNAGAGRLLEAIASACDPEATFVARLQAGLATSLAFLAAEPALARLLAFRPSTDPGRAARPPGLAGALRSATAPSWRRRAERRAQPLLCRAGHPRRRRLLDLPPASVRRGRAAAGPAARDLRLPAQLLLRARAGLAPRLGVRGCLGGVRCDVYGARRNGGYWSVAITWA
jgi:hypothetical protein